VLFSLPTPCFWVTKKGAIPWDNCPKKKEKKNNKKVKPPKLIYGARLSALRGLSEGKFLAL
jgi:hypothetical protein